MRDHAQRQRLQSSPATSYFLKKLIILFQNLVDRFTFVSDRKVTCI